MWTAQCLIRNSGFPKAVANRTAAVFLIRGVSQQLFDQKDQWIKATNYPRYLSYDVSSIISSPFVIGC